MRRGLGALVIATALVAIPLAAADAEFTDPAGDANGAPDLVAVEVANDATNRIAFGITLAGRQLLPADGAVAVSVDSDQDAATGSDGWDYIFVVASDGSSALLRWQESAWVESPSGSARVYLGAGYVLYAIDRSELGGTAALDFTVQTFKIADQAVAASDSGPAEGEWSYATVAKTFGLAAQPLLVTSKRPSVSTKVVVSMVTVRTDSIEPLFRYKTTCKITVAGKRISTVVSGREGFEECVSARLPRTAKGKLLKLTMTTSAGGRSVSRTWSARVGA